MADFNLMMNGQISGFLLDAYDAELAAEIQSGLPDKVFDAHAHPFLKNEIDIVGTPILGDLPDEGGISFWRESISAQIGGERIGGGLFFGLPVLPVDNIGKRIDSVNSFVIKELRSSLVDELSSPDGRSNCGNLQARALLLTANASDPDKTVHLIDEEPHIVGFKPYAALNPQCGPESEIHEYLPEWVCELANVRGLVVMLHISKPKALDDERNIAEINGLCKQFPGMKLVLAHAGAGFNMYNTIKGCLKLIKADNLWFDLSAISEPPAITALIKTFGCEQLLWGSDYPISLRKGRIVTLGNTIFCIQRNTINDKNLSDMCHPALLGLENLRAVLHAFNECQLRSGELEDIFYNNAMRLLNISQPGHVRKSKFA